MILRSSLNNGTQMMGIRILTQRVSANSKENDAALISSFIMFACADGYIHVAGSLNFCCNADDQWSAFPKCTLERLQNDVVGSNILFYLN